MIFFSVKKKITIKYQSRLMTFKPPPGSGDALTSHPGCIYCCTVTDLIGIGRIFESMSCKDNLQILPEAVVKSRNGFPVQLGVQNYGEWERCQYYSGLTKIIDKDVLEIKNVDINEQMASLRNKKNLRVAVLNGFGTGVGDTLIGITAFSRVYEQISKSIKPKIEVIYSPEQRAKLAPIFQHVSLVDQFHTAPITLKKLLEFDAIFDTGGMAHRPDFNKKPVIDFLLAFFGLRPDVVKNENKRNTQMQFRPGDDLNKCVQAIRSENPEKQIILLHPKTSSIFKNIPDKYIVEIVRKLQVTRKYIIVIDEPISGSACLPVIDLSSHAKSFAGLCDVISQVDGILTADTCVYHIADCFSIPTIAWFTMYDPNVWARYYPTVIGVLLGRDKGSGFLNQKPKNTEDNLRKLISLWEETDIDQSLHLLENLMQDTCTRDIPAHN